MTLLNKVAFCSQALAHTLKSSKLPHEPHPYECTSIIRVHAQKTKCKGKMMQGMLVESIYHGQPW